MRTEHYKVFGGKIHAFCGKKADVAPLGLYRVPLYECGVPLTYWSRYTRSPITCKNCLRVIANKKRKKVTKK